MPQSHKIKVAVVQATPVLFDLPGSLEKVAYWLDQARSQGAELVLFPESFLPAYPRGLSFGTVVGQRKDRGRSLWELYWQNSIEAQDPYAQQLGQLAKKNNTYLVIGVTERDPHNYSLYCSVFYFHPEGHLMAVHRKLKPTAAERIIWAEGDGQSLRVHRIAWGKMGSLICWENYMPLARMSLYQQGIELYLAPTADNRDSWQHTLKHIALEGRCFVLGANQFVRKQDYPAHLQEELQGESDIMSRGGSVIISPMGEALAGPLFEQEGILCAELDRSTLIKSKMDLDIMGHYARPDLFQFQGPSQEGT
ncbi:MAG: carbon-nitrogen hydrolase family protein [Bacteroidota bacterium]